MIDRSSDTIVLPEALPPSPLREMLWRASGHVGFLIGATVFMTVLIFAIFAPWIAPHDPYAQDLTRTLLPPVWGDGGSWAHVLGTDNLGRDNFSRLVYGARVTMIAGVGATLFSAVLGTTIGVIGGYYGGRIDAAMMFLINVKLAMPGILIALSLVSIFGGSLLVVTLILGFLFWDRFAVVTRTATQQLRGMEFVVAAEVAGASRFRILFIEILPNLTNHIIVVASLEMALAILVEASLSFLGLGIQPPMPSWGLMISEARTLMFTNPHLIMLPGMAIFTLVVGINLMGDGLRDITTPQGRS